MSDVKQRAEAEAEKKGLSGAQEQAYVGGVFNRIRQAHAQATTPGKHGARRLLKRAARREARAEAQEQIRYHEQQIAGLKEGIHLRARLDEPRKKGEGKAGAPRQPATREEQIAEAGGYVPKTPIMELRKKRPRQLTDEQLARDWQSAANWPVQSAGVERRKQALEREMARRREAKAAPAQPAQPAAVARPAEKPPKQRAEDFGPMPPLVRTPGLNHQYSVYVVNPYEVALDYGRGQLTNVLQRASMHTLREAVNIVKERNPGTRPKGSSKAEMLAYIEKHVPATTPAQPAQPAQPAAVARPAEKAPAKRGPLAARELSPTERFALSQRYRDEGNADTTDPATGLFALTTNGKPNYLYQAVYGERAREVFEKMPMTELRKTARASRLSDKGGRKALIDRLSAPNPPSEP